MATPDTRPKNRMTPLPACGSPLGAFMDTASPPALRNPLFSTKSLESLCAAPEPGAHTFKRTLGPLSLVGLGIGAIIGAGIFSLTGTAAAHDAGPAIVISFIIAAVGCGFAGLCYSELSSMIPVAGSAYTYAYASLGELVAWIIGWELTLEYAVGAATVSVSWSTYLNKLLGGLGLGLPHALSASPFDTVPGLINLPAVLIIMAASLVLIRGISESAKVNGAIVMLKVAVVVVVICVGAFYVKPANWHPFVPENTGHFGDFGWSGVARGAATVFFAYIGFDAVSTAAQETKNPGRDMPIGMMGSLAICTVLYIAFALVLTGLLPYQQLGSAAPVADAIGQTPFPILRGLVNLGAIAGLTSVILVMLLGQSRVFYSMSRDGLLPPIFSAVHPKFRTPWMSNILFMIFTGVMGGLLPIKELGELTSMGTLLAFVIVCIGVMVLRRTNPQRPRVFRTPWVPFVPIAGIVVCAAMMAALPLITWEMLIVWLVIGLAIYFTYSQFHSHLRAARGRI
jgi:APA family basic amino acid/polyamine antiporter